MQGVEIAKSVEIDRVGDDGATLGIRIGHKLMQAPGKLLAIGEDLGGLVSLFGECRKRLEEPA